MSSRALLTVTGRTLVLFGLWSVLSACSSEKGQELPPAQLAGARSIPEGGGMGGTSSFVPDTFDPGPVLTVAGSNSGGTQGSSPAAGGGDAVGGRTVTENCASSKASAMDLTEVRPADIIFAIDSSGSMGEEIDFVQTYMNEFSEQIVASGIDVHVILIADSGPAMPGAPATGGMGGQPGGGGPVFGGGQRLSVCIDAPLGSGSCPDDSNLPTYAHVPTRVASNDALTRIVDTYPMWRQHLRPEATKSFVVVTDDDARGMAAGALTSAELFDAAIRQADPMMFAEYTFNGVFCFTECDAAAAIGSVYKDLVANTKGVSGDLCLQDFQPVFNRLAEQIIQTSGASITCEWDLPAAPTGQSFSGELVEVQRTTSTGTAPLGRVASAADCGAGGWHLDSALNPTKILACPSTCQEMQNQSGGKIDITFACEALGNCIATGSATVNASAPGACDWAIPKPPQGQSIDYASVNLRYTSPSGFAANLGNVASAADCGNVEHGWYYDNAQDPERIVSCPSTCTEVQNGGAQAKVEVLFGCETIPAIVK